MPRQKGSERPNLSRRDFARGAVVAAATTVIAACKKPQPGAAPPPAPLNSEGEAQVQAILAKYGAKLDDAQKADIKRIVAANLEGAAKMRAFKLENWDEPADYFRADAGPTVGGTK